MTQIFVWKELKLEVEKMFASRYANLPQIQ